MRLVSGRWLRRNNGGTSCRQPSANATTSDRSTSPRTGRWERRIVLLLAPCRSVTYKRSPWNIGGTLGGVNPSPRLGAGARSANQKRKRGVLAHTPLPRRKDLLEQRHLLGRRQ